jgi:hypothetical protein
MIFGPDPATPFATENATDGALRAEYFGQETAEFGNCPKIPKALGSRMLTEQ